MGRVHFILAAALAITPAHASAVPDTSSQAGNTLYQISCWSASGCVTVGDHFSGGGHASTLAELWNGRHWAVLRPANPAGSMGSHLLGISCLPKATCLAVGWYFNRTGVQVPLAERWNSRHWAITRTPLPARSKGGLLESVSCAATDACTAVGEATNHAGNGITIAERWSGTHWALQRTVTPTGSGAGLTSVSCPSARLCLAVGAADISNVTVTIAERWQRGHWARQHSPEPAGATAGELEGISCDSATSCVAVGDYDSSLTLAQRWNGRSWSVSTPPNPAGSQGAGLLGLYCHANRCTAVGGYTDGSAQQVTLAQRWTGSHWQVQATINVAGESPQFLYAVACPRAADCLAVGYSTGVANTRAVLGEHWNGTVWSIIAIPNPRG